MDGPDRTTEQALGPELRSGWGAGYGPAPGGRHAADPPPRPSGIPPETVRRSWRGADAAAQTVDFTRPRGRHSVDPAHEEMAWQNYLAEEDAPEVGDDGGRLLFRILFFSTMATSVALWWFNTPAGSLSGTGAVLTAGGRITGMVGGYLLLAQVLLMSRAGWLERWIGAHHLMTWHRELGGALLVLIVGHVVLTLFGYARAQRTPVTSETWTVLSTYEDMVSALLATVLLVGTAVVAMRVVRRRMRYELWYYLHLSTYLILILGYGHQFATGEELMHGFGRWFWAGLYVFVVACLVWGRVVMPLTLNLRHRFRVAEVTPEGADMVSLYIAGRRLDELPVRAGQYFRWRFLTRGRWWQAHPFSLSAAPNGHWLRLTVKLVGDHTSELPSLRPGTRVFAEGPSGVFTADRRVAPRALLIAAGSGIAPIRALLEELPRGTAVIYRARSPEEVVFRDELDWLARDRGANVWYVLGTRDDPWPRHVFSPRGLRQMVPDIRRRDVYLCGPQGLISSSIRTLRRLRVPRRQIHLDPFEF
jgi:predicted ferric reductase